MKYVVIIGDGMADRPIDEIGGLTVLQKAVSLTWTGLRLKALSVWSGLYRREDSRPDVAKPEHNGLRSGRILYGTTPLEAASMGIELGEDRCGLFAGNSVHSRAVALVRQLS